MSTYVSLGNGYTDGFNISDDMMNEFLKQPDLNKNDVPALAQKFIDFVRSRGYELPNNNGYNYSNFGNLLAALGNSPAFANAASQGASKVYEPGSLSSGGTGYNPGTVLYDSTGRSIVAQSGQKYDTGMWSTTKPAGVATPSLGITPPASSSTPPAQQAQTNTPAATGVQPPTGNLQPGQNGPQVKQLQDWLVSQGYMTSAQVATGPGTYGPQTTAALAKWQNDHGVSVGANPGYYGPATMSAIQKATTGATGGQGGSQTGGTSTGGTAGSSSTGSSGIPSTGDPALDSILKAFNDKMTGLLSTGYTIPQGLQITPELTQQFLEWAHQNVDPQTKQLVDSKINDIKASLTDMTNQFNLSRDQTVQDFGTNLATEQNTSGANGTAFSGLRGLTERNMANSTNRTLDSLASAAENNVGSTLRSGASAVGGAGMSPVSIPGLATARVDSLGGSRGSSGLGRTLDFGYDASKYPVGTIPTQGNTTANSLAANYLTQYTSLAGANSGRSMRDLIGGITGLPQNYSITKNL